MEPPTPPRFTGAKADSSTHFACKLSLRVSYAHTPAGTPPTEQAKVVYASLFLDGDAYGWFVGLTLDNAKVYIEHENKRRVEIGWPLLELDKDYPPSWVNYPFVVDELKTFERFLRAIIKRWPVRGEAAGHQSERDEVVAGAGGGGTGWTSWWLGSKINSAKQK